MSSNAGVGEGMPGHAIPPAHHAGMIEGPNVTLPRPFDFSSRDRSESVLHIQTGRHKGDAPEHEEERSLRGHDD